MQHANDLSQLAAVSEQTVNAHFKAAAAVQAVAAQRLELLTGVVCVTQQMVVIEQVLAAIDAQKGKIGQRLKGKLPRTVRHLLKTQLALLCDQEAAILQKAEALTGAQTLAPADESSNGGEEDSSPAGPLFERGKALPARRA
jgi:hypothetical protein